MVKKSTRSRATKILSVVLLLLFTLPLLAGCIAPAGSQEDDDPSDTRTRMHISVYKAGFGIEWLEAIAAKYEEYNKDVKVVYKGDASMESTAVAALESGSSNVRDIYSLTNAINLYNNAVKDDDGDGYSDRLENLDDLYEEVIYDGKKLKDLIDPEFEDIVKINGHYYAVPWNASITGIMYNTKMFEVNNWQVPTTMEELYNLCNQIRDKGIAPLGYCGNAADGYLSGLFMGLFAQYSGPTAVDEFFKFESPDVYKDEGRLKAYETIGTLLGTDSWLVPGTQSFDHLQIQRSFIRGEVAMIIGGSWLKTEMSAYLQEYPNFDCAMMPLPWINPAKTNADGTKNGNSSNSTVLVIPKLAKNKEIAKDFLKFMCTKEMLQLYTEKTGGNPRPFTYEGVDLSNLDEWGESIMNIYLNSTNVYEVSYTEQYRLGHLKIILASDGTIVDEFNNIGSVTAGLAKAKELYDDDFEAAQNVFSV